MRAEVRTVPELDEMFAEWAGVDHSSDSSGGSRIRSVSEVPLLKSFGDVEVRWLVENLFADATVNLLTGESGHGKTTLALAVAGAIAYGKSFIGRKTIRRPVLVLDRENPLAVMRERFHQLHLEDGETFKVWGGWCEEEAPDPASPVVVEWVQSCERKPVIIVDSLVAFNPGAENDASDTRKFMHGLRRLANLGASVLVLHHSGKAETSKDYRGSSDFKAAVDTGYKLGKIGNDSGRIDRVKLVGFKNRFLGRTEITLRYADGEFRVDAASVLPSPTSRKSLIELLKERPDVKKGEFEGLAEDRGLSRKQARRFLEEGERAGMIRVETGEKNAKRHTWIGREDERSHGLA